VARLMVEMFVITRPRGRKPVTPRQNSQRRIHHEGTEKREKDSQ
jgi:hypothetical protein